VAHEASLTVAYGDADRARVVERSVRREVGEIDGDRTEARLNRDGATVEDVVAAADLVALRAGLDTWSGLLDVAERAAGA